ncbi:hypothetical protein ACYOEI_26860 [Singulisphaera rosea]
MTSALLRVALTLAVLAILGQAEASSLAPEIQVGASKSSPAIRLHRPTKPSRPALNSKVVCLLDDEVEVPDEQEDDEPDEDGIAISHKRSSPKPIALETPPSFLLSVPSPGLPSVPNVLSRPQRDRFLRFCRLLI